MSTWSAATGGRPTRGSRENFPRSGRQACRALPVPATPRAGHSTRRDAYPERKAYPSAARASHAAHMAAEHYDPFGPGPFAVGVRTVKMRDRDRSRVFPCEIRYLAAGPPSTGGRAEERDAPAQSEGSRLYPCLS